MVLGGIIELIGVWNEDGTDDGYDPFLKNSVRDQGTFANRSGIFKLADRRAPPGAPYEYMPSLKQSKRKRDGTPFSRHWYMRLVKTNPPQDSLEMRRKIVHSVCHVSRKFFAFTRRLVSANLLMPFLYSPSCVGKFARAFSSVSQKKRNRRSNSTTEAAA